ncbi:MAG: hypothetical protein JWO91_2209 [Acidobacteriaceae bacterium]|nr:hypothetical protein [Acidobacteriaceae bacterium]
MLRQQLGRHDVFPKTSVKARKCGPGTPLRTRAGSRGLTSQILHMNIGAQSGVIREVPTIVVRVRVDHDVVTIPEPVVGIIVVVWSNLKEKTTYIESIPASASEPPDVLWTNATIKASMLPRMIEMIVGIVASAVVSHPLIIFGVDVGSIGMFRLIAETVPLIILSKTRLCPLCGSYGRNRELNWLFSLP